MNDIDTGKKLKQAMFNVCRDYLQGSWTEISAEDLKLSTVKKGVSGSSLYLCTLQDPIAKKVEDENPDIPREILVRFHDVNTRSNDELVQENITFAIMSEKNLGPKLYGVFPGGRMEQYIPSRPTNWDDFSDTYISVAKELAKIHSLHMPVKKIPMLDEQILQNFEEYEHGSKVNPVNVPDFVSSGELKNEITWLLEEIHKIKPKVVFCHNDLNVGNILLLHNSSQSSGKRIKLIDYEHSAYNYRSFDIASYFRIKCLYFKAAGDPLNFTMDLDRYPTKAEQVEFTRAYVNQLYESNPKLKRACEKEKEVNDILKELQIMMFAPSLYWLTVVARDAVNSSVNIPFEGIIRTMADTYKNFKEKMMTRN